MERRRQMRNKEIVKGYSGVKSGKDIRNEKSE